MIIIVSLLYISLIVIAIMEPVRDLKVLTKEELEDHEYDQILVDENDDIQTLKSVV